MAQIDLKNATLWIHDGNSPVTNKIEIKIGEGDFSWEEKVTREYVKDRGNLDIVRNGDEEQMTISFSFVWEYIRGFSGSGIPTIEDALKGINEASTWISSSSDACEPYSVDLVIHYIPNCSTGDQEQITFPDFRYESLSHSLRDGTISCSGASNATMPIVARANQSTTLIP